MKTADILMLGGIGSGKSSVLAAIYDQASVLATGIDLKIALDNSTAVPLIQNLMAIKGAFESPDEVVEIDRFPNAQGKVIEYIFNIGRLHSQPDQRLRFNDIAGEDYFKNPSLVESLLSKSRAAILAVDVVELMNGSTTSIPLGKKRNLPDITFHHIQKWIEVSPDVPRLLVIVPIKTETWIREQNELSDATIRLNEREINSKIKTLYKTSLDLLAKDSDKSAVVITPVQTVGNLVFNNYVADTPNYPIEKWRKINGRSNHRQSTNGYSPINCDQPLRFILNFYLIQAILANRMQNKSWWDDFLESVVAGVDELFGSNLKKHYENIKNTFLDIVGGDSHLAHAIAKFSADINTDFPFEVLQGNNLLQRKTILNYFT